VIRAILCATLVIASLAVAHAPAAAASLAALPATVRVNIAGLGITYGVIGSTGTLTVTRTDGSLVYRGGARTVVRRNVRRIAGAGLTVPDRSVAVAPEERQSRAALLRAARTAARDDGPRAIETIPFELTLLSGSSDDLGTLLLGSQRIETLLATTDDGLLTLNGKAYRGSFLVTPDDDGDLIVVNTVSTHDYLASVVGAEEPSTWEPEALAAQAIAARTYLATHLRLHDAYDIEGDARNQEYGGVRTEAASTVRAVERTAGVIATYRGATIDALYSANAGGVTEDSENVYVNALPYLRSVPSPGDEVASRSSFGKTSWAWTREVTAPQLRDYLAVRGLNVGVPSRIELVRLSAAGRVLAARVTGTLGQRDIGKDGSRYFFGLRSSLYTVRLETKEETETVEYTNSDRNGALGVLGAERIGTLYQRAAGDAAELRLLSYTYRLPARFIFSGRGNGHGVGMSQWGAQGMALAGASAEEILTHYYTGIALTNVGGP